MHSRILAVNVVAVVVVSVANVVKAVVTSAVNAVKVAVVMVVVLAANVVKAALRVVIPAADRLRSVLGVIEPLAGNGVNMAVGKAQYGDVLHINSVSFMSALYRSCLGFKMRGVFQRAPSIFRQAFM